MLLGCSEAGPAAVAFQLFAVDVAGLIAGQKQNRVRQILRHGKLTGEVQQLARPAEAELVGGRHDKRNVGYHTAGGNRIAADALLHVHERRVLRRRQHRALAGAVGRAGGLVRCADRADIDDHAAFTLCKILPAFLTHSVHEAKGVDAERLMEHFIRQIGNGGVVVHDTGVVDGNVQLSKRLDCLFDHAYSCFRVADVARVPDKFAGQVFAFLRQLLEPLLAAAPPPRPPFFVPLSKIVNKCEK